MGGKIKWLNIDKEHFPSAQLMCSKENKEFKTHVLGFDSRMTTI